MDSWRALQALPHSDSTATASTSQASVPGVAGEEDGWAAFMDAAAPPLPGTATQQPASEDHWDAFQVAPLVMLASSVTLGLCHALCLSGRHEGPYIRYFWT